MGFLSRTILTGVAIALLVKIFLDLDVGRVAQNHAPGPCRYIGNVDDGSEDIVLLSSGHALISSGLKLSFELSDITTRRGRIFIFNMNKDITDATELQVIQDDEDSFDPNLFHPSGIAVWESKSTGKILLYAITGHLSKIDVFELSVEKSQLKYLRFIRDDNFHNINNIVMIDETSFLVTNFLRTNGMVSSVLEVALKLPLGSVVYYDGKKGNLLLTGLPGPNGIALSRDRTQLYLGMHFKRELHVYDINFAYGMPVVDFGYSIALNSVVDNVNVDEKGSIWVGAHPVAHKLVTMTLNSHALSRTDRVFGASQILRVKIGKKLKDKVEAEITEVFSNSGSGLEGSTVATHSMYATFVLVYANAFVIGTLVLSKVMPDYPGFWFRCTTGGLHFGLIFASLHCFQTTCAPFLTVENAVIQTVITVILGTILATVYASLLCAVVRLLNIPERHRRYFKMYTTLQLSAVAFTLTGYVP